MLRAQEGVKMKTGMKRKNVAAAVALLMIVSGLPAVSAVDVRDLPKIAVGSMGPGDAVIELKPDKYKDGKLVVKYFANTHSVSLGNYNLKESTSMKVGEEAFKPAKADDLYGHHPKGKITFLLDDLPDSFTIVIRGIPAVDERVYEWK
jgi:hypothetical protein